MAPIAVNEATQQAREATPTPEQLAGRHARAAGAYLKDAEASLAEGRPDQAYGSYVAAIVALEKALRNEQAADATRDALRMIEQHFGTTAPQLDELVAILARTGDDSDYRPPFVRGRLLSLRAWAYHRQGRPLESETLPIARQAEVLLARAVALNPHGTDIWGTLGGVRKRLAIWSTDPVEKVTWRDLALQAYRTGAERSLDPYPLINYFEMRAVLEPHMDLVRDADEQDRLERAVSLRERQKREGNERPWAAFDIARGRFYLGRDAGRLLEDLAAGVVDAVDVAKSSADAWMIETTRLSLVEMVNAGVGLPGLDRGAEYLTQALRGDVLDAGRRAQTDARDSREGLRGLLDNGTGAGEAASLQAILARLDELAASDRDRWLKADEAEFQRFLATTPLLWETTGQRAARVLWKVAGKDAVVWAAGAFVSGGATVAKVLYDLTGGWLKSRRAGDGS